MIQSTSYYADQRSGRDGKTYEMTDVTGRNAFGEELIYEQATADLLDSKREPLLNGRKRPSKLRYYFGCLIPCFR